MRDSTSKKRSFKIIYLVSIVVVLLGFLLWTAPAQLLPLALQRWLPSVQLLAVEGTLWHGRAGNTMINFKGYHVPLGDTTWQLQPLSLFTLSPKIRMTTQASTHHMTGDVSWSATGHWRAKDFNMHFPLGLLDYWWPNLVTGKATIVLNQLDIVADRIERLDGAIDLHDVVWTGGDYLMPLGDYRAIVSLSDQTVTIALHDIDARLAIEGLLVFTPGSTYRFEATLQGSKDLAPEVMQTLQFFGKKGPDGVIVISRSGMW